MVKNMNMKRCIQILETIAKEEGFKEITRMFKAIGKVEVEHEKSI